MSLRFVVLGLDHRHAYGMAEGMIGAGAELSAFWTEGTPQPLDGFVKRFPDAPRGRPRCPAVGRDTRPRVDRGAARPAG